jgi:hypothetical protein
VSVPPDDANQQAVKSQVNGIAAGIATTAHSSSCTSTTAAANGSNGIAPRFPRLSNINHLTCQDDLYRPAYRSFTPRWSPIIGDEDQAVVAIK